MKNPSAPIIRIPIAETFATVLNSMFDGFFKTCQTLFDWTMNDLIEPRVFMNIIELDGF